MASPVTPGCTTRTTLHLVGPHSWTEVPAALCYDPADPFAVRIRFGARAGSPGGAADRPGRDTDVEGRPEGRPEVHGEDSSVDWLLGRDLVHAGLSRPAGDGDVRLWPARTAVDVLFLELRAPSGHALFEMSRSVVADFLRDTERLVPRGAESDVLTVDAELHALLPGDGTDPGPR